MKRIAALQDLSCIGRCSTTVTLPVLSAMGVQCVPLPTAVLSAHTLFPHPVCRDLTDFLAPALDHWASLGIRFDAIVTGYLASAEQCRLAAEMLRRFRREDTLVIVDPAMADNGKFYAGLGPEFPAAMKGLCALADVILPNPTEAAFLTGLPLWTPIRDLASSLLDLGCREAVITGWQPDGTHIGAWGQSRDGAFHASAAYYPGSFPGTGDLFAAVYAGARVLGRTPEAAAGLGAEFVSRCVAATLEAGTPPAMGVEMEPLLWQLAKLPAQGKDVSTWEKNLK